MIVPSSARPPAGPRPRTQRVDEISKPATRNARPGTKGTSGPTGTPTAAPRPNDAPARASAAPSTSENAERASASRKTSAGGDVRLLTIAQAARCLAISGYSVRRLIWSGRLPAVRLTRRILIDASDLDRLVARSKDRVD